MGEIRAVYTTSSPSQSLWGLELGYSVVQEPGVLHQVGGAHPLLGVLDQQVGDEVLGLPRDVIPVTRGEVKVTILYENTNRYRL